MKRAPRRELRRAPVVAVDGDGSQVEFLDAADIDGRHRIAPGVDRDSLSRGTNHRIDPLREQIEQLQEMAWSIMPSTSNATRPQWQLPL